MNPRYAHTQDHEYAQRLMDCKLAIESALSPTAIDHYAEEKLEQAAARLTRATSRFYELHPGRADFRDVRPS